MRAQTAAATSHLPGHDIKTAYEMGWDTLKNGALVDTAQVEYDVHLTVDQNLQHQQSLQGRQIALIVIVAQDNKVATLEPLVPQAARPVTNRRSWSYIHCQRFRSTLDCGTTSRCRLRRVFHMA